MIGEGTIIGENSFIHAAAVVGRFCKLGAAWCFHPRVVLYDDCILRRSRRAFMRGPSSAPDGFGYRQQKGQHIKVPQLGWVEIESDVEIGRVLDDRPRHVRPHPHRKRNEDR